LVQAHKQIVNNLALDTIKRSLNYLETSPSP